MHFGEHVTIDGYGGNPVRLDDPVLVERCLTELCLKLGMHALAPPQVVHAPDNQIKDPGGWSGFVIVAESHIAVHTFPKRRFISADVYTCQNGLDHDAIVTYFTTAFDLADVETQLIVRGVKYPERNVA